MDVQIDALDLHFLDSEDLLTSYLLRGGDDIVLVESGPGSTLPHLVKGLAKHGLEPKDVTHVLLTHIHLDHAGGAGWLAQQGAHIFVHHIGAPHLIDPSRLWGSASRIYGKDMMASLWGEMLPIPEEQLTILHHNDIIEVCGEKILALDTPGHAEHHMAYLLGDICFAGDVAATCIPGQSFIRIPSPPPEFHLEKWLKSLELIRSHDPKELYLAHSGRFGNAIDFLDRLESNLHELVEFIRVLWEKNTPKEQIIAAYYEWSREQCRATGASEEIVEKYEMTAAGPASVGGVLRYLRKKSEGTL